MKVSKKLIAIITMIITVAIIIVIVGLNFFLMRSTPVEPLVSLVADPMEEPGKWSVEVANVPSQESLSDYEIVLTKNMSIAIQATSLDIMGSACSGSPGISFVDVQSDNRLNIGDFFIVCGTDTVSEYQVQIIWKSTGNIVSGDTGKILQ